MEKREREKERERREWEKMFWTRQRGQQLQQCQRHQHSGLGHVGGGQPVTITESLNHLTTGVAVLARQTWAAYGGAVLISLAATVLFVTILLSAWMQALVVGNWGIIGPSRFHCFVARAAKLDQSQTVEKKRGKK